ncbi:MAG: 4-hydroxy-3-methylbut-2-en-1-yl diphosphate synthase [Planctomycetota bacterium]|jgi:2-dehydro-3-deoxyglucarate aldolase/4-hydroxy-2-oxoheptanedioate aldolase|nr:4-hydroxy-3-methylbut-2-en-1-yl diphosphate synthase [Planctomycetota bacterium]
MKTFGNEWKRRLNSREFIVGGHIFLPNPAMAEAMVHFGYQFMWIDGEHGAFDKEQILAHITAINGAGAGAFVRVAAGDPAVIKPILEMGPDGIIIPMVNSADDAVRVMSACHYPPAGARGFGPRRANRYGTVGDREYLASIDEALVKLVQIEHRDAVRNIDAILGVKGIDGVVIGPYDLSGSLGLLGQLRHPEVLAYCEKAVAGCQARNVPCGPSIGPADDEFLKFWLDRKVDFVFCGDDLTFAGLGTAATIAKIGELRKG